MKVYKGFLNLRNKSVLTILLLILTVYYKIGALWYRFRFWLQGEDLEEVERMVQQEEEIAKIRKKAGRQTDAQI